MVILTLLSLSRVNTASENSSTVVSMLLTVLPWIFDILEIKPPPLSVRSKLRISFTL